MVEGLKVWQSRRRDERGVRWRGVVVWRAHVPRNIEHEDEELRHQEACATKIGPNRRMLRAGGSSNDLPRGTDSHCRGTSANKPFPIRIR